MKILFKKYGKYCENLLITDLIKIDYNNYKSFKYPGVFGKTYESFIITYYTMDCEFLNLIKTTNKSIKRFEFSVQKFNYGLFTKSKYLKLIMDSLTPKLEEFSIYRNFRFYPDVNYFLKLTLNFLSISSNI